MVNKHIKLVQVTFTMSILPLSIKFKELTSLNLMGMWSEKELQCNAIGGVTGTTTWENSSVAAMHFHVPAVPVLSISTHAHKIFTGMFTENASNFIPNSPKLELTCKAISHGLNQFVCTVLLFRNENE